MILDDLDTALAAVEAAYNETAAGLLPLAASAINKPALDLSRLLLGTMAMGHDSRSKLRSAAQSPGCKADEARGEGAYVQLRDRTEGEENAADGVFGHASICACTALEFLDQALALGTSVSPDQSYDEDKLLVTDYLYGQAIDQVIEADEPAVIAFLAAAIAGAAEDRLERSGSDYRIRLTTAAVDISLILGDFDEQTFALLADIRRLSADGNDGWRSAMPAGEIADFIHASKAAVSKD